MQVVEGGDSVVMHDCAEIGEELFKHLSYLSQLNNEVSLFQNVDVGGPGEYTIDLFDE